MNIIQKVKKLNFPIGQYVVISSGILDALGIRPANDVDMSVLPELHEQLRASGEWEEDERWGKIFLKKEGIEINPELSWPEYPTTTEEAIASAMIIDGIPFMNLSELKKFKQALGREKDFADIALIDAYLKEHTSVSNTECRIQGNLVNAVIEIDEVEYLVDGIAANKINNGEGVISLKRLIDQKDSEIPLEVILKAIKDKGIIDHLDIAEEIHGIPVADSYRWLENGDDEEVKKWIVEQNQYTDSFLRNEDQNKFSDELIKDFNAVEFSNLLPVKGRYFYTERRPGEDHAVLYMKDSLEGVPTKLIDPNELRKDHTISLDYWKPGWAGTYVAYGLSEGGDEMSTLYIMDINKKENLQEKIVHCNYSSIQWLPDDSGFFYTRNPRPDTVPKNEEYLHRKVYFHELGSSPDDDPLIFGAGRPKEDKINLTSSIDGRHVAIHVSNGWTENEIYIYDREQAKVIPMIVGIPAKFSLRFLSDKALLFTNYNANNYRILSTELNGLSKPIDEWNEFFPEKENLLASVATTDDRILLEYQVNACSEIIMLDYSGRELENVPLPEYSHVTAITASRTEKEFFYSIVSFTSPRITYRFNPENHKFEIYRTADNPINPEDYEVHQEWYTSKDGTNIPMFIVHKKGLLLNGINPTILFGYGGLNISQTPDFNRGLVPWIERGGIFAIANIRGGGEFGETWHKNGIKENKQNSFDDFISAAEYLISKKYTDAQHLGIHGVSFGGLLVSAVAVQRPDLFKAVCARVPLTDMVRFPIFGMAIRWVHEYGNPEIKEDMERILKWSPYHNVKEGVEYPNMLFITADKDTRVDPLHSRKMTAMLQSVNKENKILLFTEMDAGHGSGKPVSKVVESQSLVLAFFAGELNLNV